MGNAENTIVVQTERKWGCLAFLLVFVVGIVLGFLGMRQYYKHQSAKVVVETDTTYIYDTTRIVLPPVTNHIHTTDTILVVVKDTTVMYDTTYVVLPKEVKEYKGEEYYAKVSGYRPNLDEIEVYPKTTIITKTEMIAPDKNILSFGIDASYLDAFYIPIYIEYERRLHKNVGIHARMLYDLPRKSIGAEVGASVNIGW